MTKLCIIGNPVSRSLSPIIYNHLFDVFKINAHYSRLLLTDVNHFEPLIDLLSLAGANVTMPHKQTAFQITESHDEFSVLTESSNTLIFIDNGIGCNTDYVGFKESLKQHNVEMVGKSVLLIGAGNTAGTVLRVLENTGCSIDIINRNTNNANILRNVFNNLNIVDLTTLKENYDIIISAVPELDFISEIAEQIDVNTIINFEYKRNSLQKLFPNAQKKISGVDLLIRQAMFAYDIFCSRFSEFIPILDKDKLFDELNQLLSNSIKSFNNLILIGQSGAGKSTIARKLAESLNMEYISVDNIIEERLNMSIGQIFKVYGEQGFRTYEHGMLKTLQNVDNAVIDCGGGICEKADNLDLLKSIGFNVFVVSDLEQSWKRIEKTERPMIANKTLLDYKNMYYARLDNYFRTSDLIIYNNDNIKSVVNSLIEETKPILCL